MTRFGDPWADAAHALVAPLVCYHLVYAFPPLQLLPRLLRRLEAEGVPAILIAPDWPRRAWYADLVRLVADAP